MIITNEKLDRYMRNLDKDALEQAIRFIFNAPEDKIEDTLKIIRNQVMEFNKMYPQGVD